MNAERFMHGGCLCGKIRYRAEGAPASTNLCFCTQCQKQSGAAMPAFASYPVERLTVTEGNPKSYGASPSATRQFCKDCGSTLFWRERSGDTLDVFLGTFDEPDRLPRPEFAIWTAHRVSWLHDLAGMDAFPGPRN